MAHSAPESIQKRRNIMKRLSRLLSVLILPLGIGAGAAVAVIVLKNKRG